ncbi:MAG: hypothetical protein Sapg2KO_40620 [Saprospiraceae bacterium]
MDLKEKTTEKLEKELKDLQAGTGILTGLLIVLFVACIYGLIKNNESGTYTSLIIVPIALSAIIPANYKKIRKIKSELESRNEVS